MGKSKPVCTLREVVALRRSGYSLREIEKKTGVAKSTVSQILRRNRETGGIACLKKRGRKNKLKPQERAQLNYYLHFHPTATLRDLQEYLLEKCNTHLSIGQLSVWRRKSGFKSIKGGKKPTLTQHQRDLRLEWCRRYRTDNFENVFFTDEKTFVLHSYRRRLWYKPGFKIPNRASGKYGQKIHVWAGVSKGGKADIYFYKKKFKARDYLECLESSLIPIADRLFPGGWRLLHDNDGPHIARVTMQKFQEWDINLLPHTPNSPDLNPIEKVWSVIDARVQAMAPQTLGELKHYILLAWQNLSQECINNLIDGLQTVMSQVIVADGNFVDHSLYKRYRDDRQIY